MSHAAAFGNVVLVWMEHVHAGVGVGEFEQVALGGSHGDHIAVFAGRKRMTAGVDREQVRVDMEGDSRVIFDHIQQVKPHELILFNHDRVVAVEVGDAVEGIEVVFALPFEVVPAHDQNDFIGGGATARRIDDQEAGKTFADVMGDGRNVAVVGKDTILFNIKFVNEGFATADGLDAVHVSGVNPMEMEAVGGGVSIVENHPAGVD
jgi:hypothetical protein